MPRIIFNFALNKFKEEKLEEFNKKYQEKFLILKPKVSILKGNDFDKTWGIYVFRRKRIFKE